MALAFSPHMLCKHAGGSFSSYSHNIPGSDPHEPCYGAQISLGFRKVPPFRQNFEP